MNSAQTLARAQQNPLQRRDTWLDEPLSVVQHLSDERDDLFARFGLGRNPLSGRRLFDLNRVSPSTPILWTPQIEVEERGQELVVRADLPGIKKEDVKISIGDDILTLQGERQDEREEKRAGYYHSERSYGSFYRQFLLPRC